MNGSNHHKLVHFILSERLSQWVVIRFAFEKAEALSAVIRLVSDIIYHIICTECKQGWAGKLLPLQASAVL